MSGIWLKRRGARWVKNKRENERTHPTGKLCTPVMTRPACGPLVGTKCASRYLAAGTRARAVAVAVAVAAAVVASS